MGKKKEKITYVDDGRTLADMSGLSAPRLTRNPLKPAPRAKEVWATYWNAVKMMFLPMLAVIGALVVIYGVMYLIFSLAA
ncbi:MAG: hypothetical protein IJO72_00710 [Oscillospiraceae bacterium]|nr:hypothetical protein [Oscillospiraceae bacterium]